MSGVPCAGRCIRPAHGPDRRTAVADSTAGRAVGHADAAGSAGVGLFQDSLARKYLA